MKSRFALLFGCLLFVASTVNAGILPEDWYVKGFTGINFVGKESFSISGDVGSTTGTDKHKIGFLNGAAVGYKWCDIRFEGELSYRSNHLDKRFFEGDRSWVSSVDRTVWAGMFNVYYHFNMEWCIEPYLGAGVGVAYQGYHGSSCTEFEFNSDDSDLTFGYQGMVGFLLCADDCWDLFVEYRYFGTTDPTFAINAPSNGKLKSEYDAHAVNFGTIYNF